MHRLLQMQIRVSQQRFQESSQQKRQRLENLRIHAAEIRSQENNERREFCLAEQRRRNFRRHQALQNNTLATFKLAMTTDFTYYKLGDFNVPCCHCKALHFPEERVSNRQNLLNFFGDCCLHGRINLPPA